MTRSRTALWNLACGAALLTAGALTWAQSEAPAPAPAAPAPSAPAPAPTQPRKPARPRPATADELKARVSELTAAQDFEGLWAMCRDLPPKVFEKDPASPIVVELCRGRALQGLAERDKARASYEAVLRMASAPNVAGMHGVQVAASEARYRMAEIAEAEYETYPLCLRALGIFWGSRAEADEKVARFKRADQAYAEAIPHSQRPWPQRAAFRRAALHAAFYQEVAGRSAPTFRGLSGPPPLPNARVEVANDALRLVLDPSQSNWPRSLKEVAQAAAQRAELEGDDPDLQAAARELLHDVEVIATPPRAPMTSPFPPRHGNDRGWKGVTIDGETVTFEERGGALRQEALLKVGPQLVDVVKGGTAERWAPDAAIILGQGGYRAAIPALSAAALGVDEEVAVAAIHALGELGGAAEIPVLLDAYARATPPGDAPAPYDSPAMAVYGVRERVLEALSRIARKDPVPFLAPIKQNALPRREMAFVLWQAARKEFRPLYNSFASDGDDFTALYGVLGITTVSPAEGRAAAQALKGRKNAACMATHVDELLKPLAPKGKVTTESRAPLERSGSE